MNKFFFLFTFLITFIFHFPSFPDEIIRDHLGNYYLMRHNGTFKKLPQPKPGHTYIIKEKNEKLVRPKKQSKVFKRVESLKNVKQNKGSR